jgi:small GTP-binding protein
MKIVVSGPLQCGKSSFIRKLDENALNVEAKARDNKLYTVGMDLGCVKLNGFDVFLFGTPGLLRFNVMRDVVIRGADGLIFIFDAAHPEKDEDAIIILNSIRKMIVDAPIVYLANKQDIAGARHPEVVRTQNYLPQDAVIFGTSTKTGENLEEALKNLVNQIYENYSSLIQILKNYEENIPGLAEKLNKDPMQMRDFLNNLEIKRFIEIDRQKKIYKVKEGLKFLV